MAHLNITVGKKNTFDAIVIGSGMAGGWAAKEFCEKGLKTLVLERGNEVKHNVNYPTATKDPWEFEHHGKVPLSGTKDNPVLERCYAYNEGTAHFFVKDKEHPIIQDKPFDWIRGYQTGGKSLLWARQVQRWSDFDFGISRMTKPSACFKVAPLPTKATVVPIGATRILSLFVEELIVSVLVKIGIESVAISKPNISSIGVAPTV